MQDLTPSMAELPQARPIAGFRLLRYFTVVSLAAFLPVAAVMVYLGFQEGTFFEQVQQEQHALFGRAQDGFAQQYSAAAQADLLRMQEAGTVNLARMLANAMWEKDFAPFTAKAQSIPVDQCRAIADVRDAGGKTVQPAEKQGCYAGIGKQIMAFPEFHALDAKVFDIMKNGTVFKIKAYDLRGITVYSSEHNQIGEDKTGNAGWNSAVAGKATSELTHRDKFSAFEGVVENRDLISSYVPVRASGSEKIVAVFEIYSDVTRFLEQTKKTLAQIVKLAAENQAEADRAMAANRDKVATNVIRLIAIVFALLALLYFALLVIVRRGQRIIDAQDFERTRAEEKLVAFAAELEVKVASRTEALALALEAATESDRLKSDFMAAITHELRTPLNSVIGFAELLKDSVAGPLNAKQAAFAADILASGRLLLALVEGILEMSRLDATGVAIESEPVEIGAALEERVAAKRPAAEARRVSIALEVAADAGSAVLDRSALRRILDSLLDNAIKFNRDGGTVAVSARRDDGWLAIAVADTGIGIAQDDLPKLFKPLVQLDAGLTRRHGGVGLGLVLARRLAELHGGTIEVESEPGRGSTFTLRLPIREKS